MKNYGNQVISIILVFIVTMLLNVGIEQFFKSNGSIQVDEIQRTTGAAAALVRVENYSKERINELKILIPKELQINQISTSTPIQIEEVSNTLSTSKQKIISLSLIPPKSISTILMPMAEGSYCCSILNSEELKIAVKEESDVLNPSMHALYKGLQTAIIYTVFFALAVLWYKSQHNELATKIETIKEKQKKIEEEHNEYIEKTKGRLREVESKFGRHKAILLRRLSDYSKELEFWRATIRKLLYQSDAKNSNADKLLAHVTQKLGTFGTRSSSADEFETIQALAQDIVEHEEKSK